MSCILCNVWIIERGCPHPSHQPNWLLNAVIERPISTLSHTRSQIPNVRRGTVIQVFLSAIAASIRKEEKEPKVFEDWSRGMVCRVRFRMGDEEVLSYEAAAKGVFRNRRMNNKQKTRVLYWPDEKGEVLG